MILGGGSNPSPALPLSGEGVSSSLIWFAPPLTKGGREGLVLLGGNAAASSEADNRPTKIPRATGFATRSVKNGEH